MRYIHLRNVKPEDTAEIFSYKDQIKVIASQKQDGSGFNIEETRQAIRILEALQPLDPHSGILQLEDADYAYLTAKLKTWKFGMAHAVLIDFYDDIMNAGSERPAHLVSEVTA